MGNYCQTSAKEKWRLPIIITGLGTEQLLGAPKLDRGTGENNDDAIVETLNDWGIADIVKAFCFDTTASNTGKKKCDDLMALNFIGFLPTFSLT